MKAGINYENKITALLDEKYSHLGGTLSGAWIKYDEEMGTHSHYCQPDIILFDPWKGYVYIIECKLTHNSEAFYQMSNKYLPILEWMFPKWKFACIEVFKNFSRWKWPRLEGCIASLEEIKQPGYYMWNWYV